ncbi:LysR family transcriptional regulator [Lactobacillus corticis]|uniref:LysR family transcriptional regulator n=1 Tax=Lactobacillus corticis TaxID=2201249 RepID=A0A916QKZ6_9LACO|nr:LysR family transcriptional regulator [Lactobacillus corticis]GFZ27625.1 LysR family transcriptional regulator [Lactobacillus corticis]
MATYNYYKIFYFAAFFKSFSKAAEVLYSNQPNVARSITRLESELGCKLFVRSNRGVTLTPEGEALYKHVAIAYEALTAGEKELAEMQGLKTGNVAIGASETALRLFLLDRVEKFHNKYPGVHLKIRNSQTMHTYHALENGQVDFAVITAPLDTSKEFHTEVIYQFQEVLIGGPQFSQYAGKKISFSELAKLPLIGLTKTSSSYEFYTHFFLQHGIPYDPDIETETVDQILSLVKHGFGFGFFPASLAKKQLRRGKILTLDLEQAPEPRKTYLVYNPERNRSLAVQKAIDFIRKP